MNKTYFKEIAYTVGTFFWFLFVATNVNQVLGQTYQGFTALSGLLLIIGIAIFDKNLNVTYAKQTKLLNAILAGVGGYVALLFTSVIVLRIISPTASLSSVLSLMATTPALSNSKVINFLTFGLVIPFIETTLFARVMELIADRFKIQINRQNITKLGLIFIIILLSIGFALFHITSKGITATGSLLIVFIMMFYSLLMVVWYNGDTRPAILLHIFANSVASWLALFSVGELMMSIA
ncbi:MAG: hypothetical protein WC758_07745 [Candidatus Woesearchaeota archaeon]|jgi:hypothetical protein